MSFFKIMASLSEAYWLYISPHLYMWKANIWICISDVRLSNSYYAPPSRSEGPRRCPDRGNTGGALVFMYLFWLLYAMGVYTY